MPDPYGITQVDIPGVVNAVQTSQQNRLQQLLLQQHISAAERAAERENRFNMVLARLVPGADGASPGKTGTASAVGAYGGTPATSLPSPTMPVSPASVAPVGVSGAVGAYGTPSPAATPPAPAMPGPASPAAAPAPTAAAPAAADPSLRLDPNAARQLLTIDPGQAGPIITQLRTLDDDRIHRLAAANDYLARFGNYLLHSNIPEAQWAAEIQRRSPDLLAHGVDAAQIQQFQANRQNVEYVVNQAQDMDHLVAAARPDLMVVPQGASVVNKDTLAAPAPATGGAAPNPVVYESPVVNGPNGEPFARPPSMSGTLPRPRTPAEAAQLPPGSHFLDPNGVVRTVPGGPTPPASGNFPQSGVW